MVVEVKFDGRTIHVEPQERLPDGGFMAVSLSHHPRFPVGARIRVSPDQVVVPPPGPLDTGLRASQPTRYHTMADHKVPEFLALAGITASINEVKNLANDAAKKFKGSVANLTDAVAQTHAVADHIDSAAKQIRDNFGIQTNGVETP